jgi:hypothetical protein
MSKDRKEEVEAPPAEVAPPVEEAPVETKSVTCSGSPTGEHDVFHNEATDEKYCRYCGYTE